MCKKQMAGLLIRDLVGTKNEMTYRDAKTQVGKGYFRIKKKAIEEVCGGIWVDREAKHKIAEEFVLADI